MQAIQIKYLSQTNTKPSRLKAWTIGGTVLIKSRNSSLDISLENEAEALARQYISNMIAQDVWCIDTKITGFGVIPNGDYVATIGV